MKRRGFLGLLAALPALARITTSGAVSVLNPQGTEEIGKDRVAALIHTAVKDDGLTPKDGHWDGDIDVSIEGDKTVFSVWQASKGKFVSTHAWYLPPGADVGVWYRTHDGRFLPLEGA